MLNISTHLLPIYYYCATEEVFSSCPDCSLQITVRKKTTSSPHSNFTIYKYPVLKIQYIKNPRSIHHKSLYMNSSHLEAAAE